MNKEAVLARLKEPTTYLGLAGLVVAAFGLPEGSGEQIAALLGSIAAIFMPEAGAKK